MNLSGAGGFSASEVIGSVEVLEAKIASVFSEPPARAGVRLGLHAAILEHGLDAQIAALQACVVGGRARCATSDGVAIGGLGAALVI